VARSDWSYDTFASACEEADIPVTATTAQARDLANWMDRRILEDFNVSLGTSGASLTHNTPEVNNTINSPKQRAERLLRRTLPKKEWYRYMIKGYVLVWGSEGGLYQLTKKKAYGVNQWRPIKRTICTVPADIAKLDPADFITAQYLSLLNDEKGFLKITNVAGSYQGPGAHTPRRYDDMADAYRYANYDNTEFRREYQVDYRPEGIHPHDVQYALRYAWRSEDREKLRATDRYARFRDCLARSMGSRNIEYAMEHLYRFERQDECAVTEIRVERMLEYGDYEVRMRAIGYGDRHRGRRDYRESIIRVAR